jgi:hypothetical protein
MPDMNMSDMDDLFKRAAENYPLRTDSADWDKVARALDEDDTVSAMIPSYSGRGLRNRRYLLLLLLIPLAAIGYLGIRKSMNPAGEKTVAGATSSPPDAVIKTDKTFPASSGGKNENPVSVAARDNHGVDQNHAVSGAETGAEKNLLKGGIGSMSAGEKGNRLAGNGSGQMTVDAGHSATADQAALAEASGTGTVNNPVSTGTGEEASLKMIRLPGIVSFGGLPDQRTAFVHGNQGSTGSNLVNGAPKQTAKKDSHSRFYVGLLVAPDISTVKFQSVKGVGITAGALLGYRLSSRISLETGLYYDSKKYYTKGEYFSKKNMNGWLNNVDLLDVNGACNMLEVPVNLRYNVLITKKSTWFATTGLSSYFIFKEAYNYSYVYNGYAGESKHTYNNPSQNWFSIINFTAGYEHTIGKVGNLRLEPYLRIPLSGMGTGSLPIFSSGLNVGITRDIK